MQMLEAPVGLLVCDDTAEYDTIDDDSAEYDTIDDDSAF